MFSPPRGCCLLLLFLACGVFGVDHFVSPSAGDNGDGSELNPFSSMSAAMENVGETTTAVTFILFPGTYEGTENQNIVFDSLEVDIISYELWSNDVAGDSVEFRCSDDSGVFRVSGSGKTSLTGTNFFNCSLVLVYESQDHQNSSQHPISISDCSFASTTGDIIISTGGSELTARNCIVDQVDGQFIRMVGASDGQAVANLANINITQSGGLYLQNIALSMESCHFVENLFRPVFLNPTPGSENSISRCSVLDPPVSYEGASMYIQTTSLVGEPANVIMDGNSFVGGEAAASGGALYLGHVVSSIIDSSFSSCSSMNGGALFIVDSLVELTRCLFDSTTANVGGAVYLDNSSIQLNQVTFSISQAISVGNTVYCESGDEILSIGATADSATNFEDSNCQIMSYLSTSSDYNEEEESSVVESSGEEEESNHVNNIMGYSFLLMPIQCE